MSCRICILDHIWGALLGSGERSHGLLAPRWGFIVAQRSVSKTTLLTLSQQSHCTMRKRVIHSILAKHCVPCCPNLSSMAEFASSTSHAELRS
mmetsp:Transcript_31745/g.69372  ORF Transcript_31745/g.69372 Transcript_31745/m.69372 type:complete len:93 (+) Transcript_31745:783-1061(+)